MRIIPQDLAFIALGFLAVGAGGGFLLGQASAPVDTELASAQLVAQDRDVRWVGRLCGDDGATVVGRDMPDITECQGGVSRLSDVREFPVPPRR